MEYLGIKTWTGNYSITFPKFDRNLFRNTNRKETFPFVRIIIFRDIKKQVLCISSRTYTVLKKHFDARLVKFLPAIARPRLNKWVEKKKDGERSRDGWNWFIGRKGGESPLLSRKIGSATVYVPQNANLMTLSKVCWPRSYSYFGKLCRAALCWRGGEGLASGIPQNTNSHGSNYDRTVNSDQYCY